MAYDFKNSPTNPDAKPLYNDNILKIWNWFDDVWSCADWMQWHKSLRSKYGLENANYKFMLEWENLATGSSAIDCRTFNTAFRSYMNSVGLLDALYSGIGIIAKPIGGGIDVIDNVGGAIVDSSKVVKTIIPILLVIGAVLLVLFIYKKTKR
jgi:hypothetical protein